MKERINNTYYAILVVLGLSFFIFITLTVVFIFNEHITINLTGSNENDNIVAITGIISAILVFFGFRLQAKQLKISNANRDFDRYNKMIDEISLYENKICLKYIISSERSGKQYNAISYDAIDLYLDQFYAWDKKTNSARTLFDQDSKEFYRNVYILVNYIKFIFENLKKLDNENLDILSTKLIYTIPEIIVQGEKILILENTIMQTYNDEFSKDFLTSFKEFKIELDIMTEHLSNN